MLNKKFIFIELFKLASKSGWETQCDGINRMLSTSKSEVEFFLTFSEDGSIEFKGETISLIAILTDFELKKQCSLYYLIKNKAFDGFKSYNSEHNTVMLSFPINFDNMEKLTQDIMFSFKIALISTPKSKQLDLFLNAFKHLIMYKYLIIFLFLATSCSKTNYTITRSKAATCPSNYPYEVKEQGQAIGCVTCKKDLLEELKTLHGGKYVINLFTNRVYKVKSKPLPLTAYPIVQ